MAKCCHLAAAATSLEVSIFCLTTVDCHHVNLLLGYGGHLVCDFVEDATPNVVVTFNGTQLMMTSCGNHESFDAANSEVVQEDTLKSPVDVADEEDGQAVRGAA